MSLNYGMLGKATTNTMMAKFATKDPTGSKDSERPPKRAKVDIEVSKDSVKELKVSRIDMLDGCVCHVRLLFLKNGNSSSNYFCRPTPPNKGESTA